jgi:hypothetical protein
VPANFPLAELRCGRQPLVIRHHARAGRRIYKFELCGVYLEKDEHALKKIAIIGLFVVIVLTCLLLYWQRVKIARFDDDFRQHLAGVWVRQEVNMRCTNTVAADGSFVELSWFSHPDRTNTYQRTGTWLVKNGRLIETIKSSTNPAEVTPHTGTGKIIHPDADEFVVRWQNSAETVWEKVIQ